MQYGPGFYKKDEESIAVHYAPSAVCSKDYELFREMKTTYTFPIDGWYWYETGEEAFAAFGLEMPAIEGLTDNRRKRRS